MPGRISTVNSDNKRIEESLFLTHQISCDFVGASTLDFTLNPFRQSFTFPNDLPGKLHARANFGERHQTGVIYPVPEDAPQRRQVMPLMVSRLLLRCFHKLFSSS